MKTWAAVATVLVAVLGGLAVGQTPHINIVEVHFKTGCSFYTTLTENKTCVNKMLTDLAAAVYDSFKTIKAPVFHQLPSNTDMPIVMKFVEEQDSDTDILTMTVYETENNTEVYRASRNRLLLNNDVTKLLTGYAD